MRNSPFHVGGKLQPRVVVEGDQVKAAVLYRSDIQKFVDETVKDRQYRKGRGTLKPSLHHMGGTFTN